jgi:tetratricopeptide (TPR) repeat protein
VQFEDPAVELLAAAREALQQGMLERASSHAQRAGIHGASRVEVLLLQGEIFLRRGAAGEAVERFNEALAEVAREVPADEDTLRRALFGAARALLDLDRRAEAVEAAERLVELMPSDVESQRVLGETLARVEDYARAAIVLEHARLAAPQDVHLHTQLGLAYYMAGDDEGAESALRRALSLDAAAVAARTALGRVLARAGRDEEAAAEYGEALDTLPSYGDAAFGLAELHESAGRTSEAVNVLADLLSLDPYRLDALVRLGDLLAGAGMKNEARFAYDRVLRFDPGDEGAQAGLARLNGGRH